MKKFMIAALLLIVVASAGIFYVMGSLDGLIKSQIELHASNALKTKVSVGAVKLKLLDGFGEISGFKINNPDGFSDEQALSFEAIRLDIGTENLGEMPIIIEEITIDSLSALVEMNQPTNSNIKTLLDNVASGTQSSKKPPEQPEETSDTNASSEPSDVRILVKQLTIKDTALALDLTALGDKKYQETLPTLHIENIGAPNGVPPEQLGTEMASAILKKLKKEAQKKQTEKLKNKAIDKIKEKSKEGLKGLMDKL